MRIKIDNDMKRIFTLMLLSLAVVMGGCEKDNTYEDPAIHAYPLDSVALDGGAVVKVPAAL